MAFIWKTVNINISFYHKNLLNQFNREAVVKRELVLLVDVFSQHSAGQRVICLRSHAEGTQLQYQGVFFFHMGIRWHKNINTASYSLFRYSFMTISHYNKQTKQ